jgi:hypothetical protein
MIGMLLFKKILVTKKRTQAVSPESLIFLVELRGIEPLTS